MHVDIPYGEGTLAAELPERTTIVRGGARAAFTPVDDLVAEARRALAHPLGCGRVGTLARKGSRVTIAFDDPTVFSFGPVREVVIRQLLGELEEAGVRREDVTLVCANALHRKFRHEELALTLGDDLVLEFGQRLVCHDAENPAQLAYLGKTPPGGHDVEVSRVVTDSDLTIYVNAAHNRGFSGGWKSICVGLSTFRSIRAHHTPTGMSMSLDNNRMHAMLDEMGRMVEAQVRGPIFKVDTILANPLEVSHMFAGTIWQTRQAVVNVMRTAYAARRDLVEEKADVVVYGIGNWSPYAIYASMNPLLTLISSGLGYLGGTVQAVGKPGCTVIMVTPCPDTWDRQHHASYPFVWQEVLSQTQDADEIQARWSEVFATRGELIEKYRNEYAYHPVHAIMATYPLVRLRHIGQVFVAAPQAPHLVRHLGFEPFASVEAAIDRAIEIHGSSCRVAYIAPPSEASTH